MNGSDQNTNGIGGAEETLRFIAKLPAPEGIEERVQDALRLAPRGGRVLSWPAASGWARRGWMESGLARSAAAAAIVFVVVGGGWGVYSRVKPVEGPKVVVMPRPGGAGFSSAGAMRTPNTVNGTVLTHPLNPPSIQPAVDGKKMTVMPGKKSEGGKKAAKSLTPH
jgi:hypothetical protein